MSLGEPAGVPVMVEDGQLRRALGQMLEARGGYRTEEVGTGEEAEARATDAFFHVVVLDSSPVDSDWVDLLRRLRQIHPPMQGILVGNDMGAEIINKAVQEGVFACIVMPPKLEELLEVVRKALEKQQLEWEAQDRQRKALVSVISHELRSPLTSILFSADLMIGELPPEFPPPLLKLTENIVGSARRMDDWIQDLSDLSKLRVGGGLHLQVVNPEPLLRRAVDEVGPEIRSRDQSVIVQIAGPLPPVRLDERRVEQLVTGLLMVAGRSSPTGSKIVLAAGEGADGLRVEIHDGATPIRQDVLKRFFYPYHRIETDKQHLARLGLALGLARQLVELHGGRIWVESNEKEGNTFAFSLPLDGGDPDRQGGEE